MLIFLADQDSEKDYGFKGNYNTESRESTKNNLWRKGLFKNNIEEFGNLINENQNKPKELKLGATR